jgi:hypothetical protein
MFSEGFSPSQRTLVADQRKTDLGERPSTGEGVLLGSVD